MMKTMLVNAYAKVNYSLDVFSLRPDGYHGVASVMQAISLHDTLELSESPEPGIHFTCDGPESAGIPLDASNLVYRAAAAALDAAGKSDACGVAIHLTKNTPSQAGLGGGSSDAAAALAGVNSLLGLGLANPQLHALAASLGSDVPFFLMGGTAVARGRGEQLTAVADAPPLWLVVVKPEDSVSTGWAYGQLDADVERQSHRGTKRLEQAMAEGDVEQMLGRMCNDFEGPVFRYFPRLAWLYDEMMMAGARTARLCGSGSALFAAATSEPDAHRIAGLLQKRYPKTYVCRTLSREESLPIQPAASA